MADDAGGATMTRAVAPIRTVTRQARQTPTPRSPAVRRGTPAPSEPATEPAAAEDAPVSTAVVEYCRGTVSAGGGGAVLDRS